MEMSDAIASAGDFQLTADNYYSREADIYFMSCSQYQGFLKCEAAAVAKLRGLWQPKETPDALFQGQYFHSYFEGPEAFERFCGDNADKIFKTKITKARGVEIVGKYAPFERMDEMIRVVQADPLIACEWARIPHFYYNFYVYKYATGMSAAIRLADRILRGTATDREAYFGFLKAGGSRDVLDIMRDAGVDLSTPEPVRAALRYFRRTVEQLRRELGR